MRVGTMHIGEYGWGIHAWGIWRWDAAVPCHTALCCGTSVLRDLQDLHDVLGRWNIGG